MLQTKLSIVLDYVLKPKHVCAGRIMDFIESGKLATDAVKFFVLDEADRLLDSGSQDLVMKLFSKLPKAATGTQRLQVCTTPSPPSPTPPSPTPSQTPLSRNQS